MICNTTWMKYYSELFIGFKVIFYNDGTGLYLFSDGINRKNAKINFYYTYSDLEKSGRLYLDEKWRNFSSLHICIKEHRDIYILNVNDLCSLNLQTEDTESNYRNKLIFEKSPGWSVC